MPTETDAPADNAELAAILKKWRGVTPEQPHGAFPVSRAAQILGIPKRTLEGIEQGRGFRYPRLLILAILSFGAP